MTKCGMGYEQNSDVRMASKVLIIPLHLLFNVAFHVDDKG